VTRTLSPVRETASQQLHLPPSIRDGTRRFFELALATLSGRPSAASQYLPESSYEHHKSIFCNAIEQFLIARLYAHLILHHHLGVTTRSLTLPRTMIEVADWTTEQQLEADCLALELMRAVDESAVIHATQAALDPLDVVQRLPVTPLRHLGGERGGQ
jgi:hypothetical protein